MDREKFKKNYAHTTIDVLHLNAHSYPTQISEHPVEVRLYA